MEPEGSLLHSQQPVAPPHSEPDQSSPCPSSNIPRIHLNFILPSNHGSSKWSLSLRFPHQNPVYTSQTLHTPLLSPISATCPAHLIFLDLITRTFCEECRSLSSSLCSLLHSLVSSSFLGPNILSTPFSNTLTISTCLNVSDQVSHPYTTDKIIVLYILILKFLDIKLEDKRFSTE